MNTPARPSDATLFDAPPAKGSVIGDNRPPPFDPAPLKEKDALIADFMDAAGEWLDLGEIETDAQSGHLTDFVSGARGLAKQVEAWRVDAKAPHMEAAKAVDDAARLPADKLKRAIDKALDMLGKYAGKKKRAAEAEAQRQREEAAARQAEADRLAREAEARNDLAGQAEAEAASAKAQADARQADRVAEGAGKMQSASGAGRTISTVKIRTGRIDNLNIAFMEVRDDPRVVEAIQMAINARIRAAGFEGTLRGVTIITEERAR